jgi:glycosyltransferase involved in cell wall biosynthesis
MPSIAVLIPCLNEQLTVAKVVGEFRAALPQAAIHVFDNRSTDRTAERAREVGALVHSVSRPGKGHVVRAMFREIDADAAVMVDGDGTYPADRVVDLLAPVLAREAEMVVGSRLAASSEDSFRSFHKLGNRIVCKAVNLAFGARLTDVLSGYRAFSREFMQSMPVLSRGFEIETEMTAYALAHDMRVLEVVVPYGARAEGSRSKLHTFRDGYRVLKTILWLFKDYRPLLFFGSIGALAIILGIIAGAAVIQEFLVYGRVVGAARAVFAVGSFVVGLLATMTGFVLDTVNRNARELNVLIVDRLLHRRQGASGVEAAPEGPRLRVVTDGDGGAEPQRSSEGGDAATKA